MSEAVMTEVQITIGKGASKKVIKTSLPAPKLAEMKTLLLGDDGPARSTKPNWTQDRVTKAR
jgi:hypothetical protein